MTTLRETAQQVLDAIESDTVLFSAWTEKMLAARTALRVALAQQAEPLINQCGETCERAKLCAVCASKLAEQGEPVAWVKEDVCDGQYIDGRPRKIWWECNKGVGTAFYTAPPQQEAVVWGVDWGRSGDLSCVSIVKKQADVINK